MNIPNHIIEAIEVLPFADRALAYAAIIQFMKDGSEVEESQMTPTAYSAFRLARLVLIPILRRRKRDAANRAAKRAAANPDSIAQIPESIAQKAETPAKETVSAPTGGFKLNRAQRRQLARLEAKNRLRA